MTGPAIGQIWLPNSKKANRQLHGRYSAKKHVYRQLRGAATHSHHEGFTNTQVGEINTLKNGRVRLSAVAVQAKDGSQQ